MNDITDITFLYAVVVNLIGTNVLKFGFVASYFKFFNVILF